VGRLSGPGTAYVTMTAVESMTLKSGPARRLSRNGLQFLDRLREWERFSRISVVKWVELETERKIGPVFREESGCLAPNSGLFTRKRAHFSPRPGTDVSRA